MSEQVVYINLTNTPLAITNERGGGVIVLSNQAVKGEYFARWAQPKGPLSMMHESQVAPSAVIYEAKPYTIIDEQRWAEVKAKVDPILFKEEVGEPEVAVEEAPAVTTTETDKTEAEGKKKRKK